MAWSSSPILWHIRSKTGRVYTYRAAPDELSAERLEVGLRGPNGVVFLPHLETYQEQDG